MTATSINTPSPAVPGAAITPSGRALVLDPTKPVLDVVIPVHDEEADLATCVYRLHDYLSTRLPYPFRITIADNASTDTTLQVAHNLAAELDGVAVVHLAAKGRGRALAHVWSRSEALVLAYLDVDLSTDLAALGPLVAPLLSGHSDVAIGSRLARGSLAARFSDAQCGFKAIRVDDPDSRVDVVATEKAGMIGQLARFGAVGVASTLAYLGLYVALVGQTGAQAANLVALLVTAVLNTAANRRLTFGVSGSGHTRDQLQGLVVFGLGLALTSGALVLLHALVPGSHRGLEVAVLVTANLTATVMRFVMMRTWMFGARSTRIVEGVR